MSTKKRVLFVEDEDALQKSMGRALEFEGFDVISAYDGAEGLEMARKENPDIILLDLVLPKMDGFEVLKALKDDPKTKDCPVVILTNLESPPDIEKVFELGATTYLVKANYDLKVLVDKVRGILEKGK